MNTIFSTFVLKLGKVPRRHKTAFLRLLFRRQFHNPGSRPLGTKGARLERGGICRSRLEGGPAPPSVRLLVHFRLQPPTRPSRAVLPDLASPPALRGPRMRSSGAPPAGCERCPQVSPAPVGTASGATAAPERAGLLPRGGGLRRGRGALGGSIRPALGLRPRRPPLPLGILGRPDRRKVGAGEPVLHFDSSWAL